MSQRAHQVDAGCMAQFEAQKMADMQAMNAEHPKVLCAAEATNEQ